MPNAVVNRQRWPAEALRYVGRVAAAQRDDDSKPVSAVSQCGNRRCIDAQRLRSDCRLESAGVGLVG